MTETITHIQQDQEQPVAAAGELSGVDLARVALHQAREAAKARGASSGARKASRSVRTSALRRDGREVTGFGAVLQGLMADRAWDIPTAGGSILDRWPDIAAAVSPHLAAHVTATAFHTETGQLDLRPDSPAYATQLRLLNARIIAAANDAADTHAVRTIRVLAVGQTTVPESRPAAPASSAAAVPAAPARTRNMAAAGFHRALAAHQAVPRTREVALDIAEAAARQTRVLRELSQQAFPAPEELADEPAPIDRAVLQRRRAFAATETAALHRARAERAQRAGAAVLLPQAARLRSSA
ncbi:DciA family protein [Streptomyces virginiae]|uniref:DciA family protein n=1 Tax=Streptomyces virginiae TaxID=1961 RepID=UPI002252525A|nr:DciA family protein [Streptomyces virginiae]MCX5278188.1 DciA family protein [Streptomyces virginiae]